MLKEFKLQLPVIKARILRTYGNFELQNLK